MGETFHIQWHITNRCNLRCVHCYQDGFSWDGDLGQEGLMRVADRIFVFLEDRRLRGTIHLTGGEPLLKPELFALLDYLDRSPLIEELGVITNGLLLNQEVLARFSTCSKLKKIKLSLDGASEKTNDSIRGMRTFDTVLERLGSIQKVNQFEIVFMFTLMKRNFRELYAFYDLSRGLGVSGFIVERFVPWGRGREKMSEVLGREEWSEVKRTLSDLFSIEKESLLPYQAFQVNFSEEGSELSGAPCVIGQDGLCLMPDGEVFPCRRFPVSIGNLLQMPLREIWEGSELLNRLRQRENLRGRCGQCGIEGCRGCRALALALRGDPLAEDPCCGIPEKAG
ncbi:MAG: radical SAM protein [Desulfobacterota bacterium]|nr:radical SAM protein [Thermodesulfobacteriota bacterium]